MGCSRCKRRWEQIGDVTKKKFGSAMRQYESACRDFRLGFPSSSQRINAKAGSVQVLLVCKWSKLARPHLERTRSLFGKRGGFPLPPPCGLSKKTKHTLSVSISYIREERYGPAISAEVSISSFSGILKMGGDTNFKENTFCLLFFMVKAF